MANVSKSNEDDCYHPFANLRNYNILRQYFHWNLDLKHGMLAKQSNSRNKDHLGFSTSRNVLIFSQLITINCKTYEISLQVQEAIRTCADIAAVFRTLSTRRETKSRLASLAGSRYKTEFCIQRSWSLLAIFNQGMRSVLRFLETPKNVVTIVNYSFKMSARRRRLSQKVVAMTDFFF